MRLVTLMPANNWRSVRLVSEEIDHDVIRETAEGNNIPGATPAGC